MTRWYDSTVDRNVETFETDEETTLRVDADTLVFASALTLSLRLAKGDAGAEAVDLDASIDRSQVLKMVKAGALPGVSVMDLTKLDPSTPVRLRYQARADMLAPLSAALAGGMSLEQCVLSKDPSGFPAFLDLENYQLVAGPPVG
jgi:hypothetical protein